MAFSLIRKATWLAVAPQEIYGLLYRSVQRGANEKPEDNGFNIAIFQKAAECEKLDIPTGTKLGANFFSTDDGLYPHFSIMASKADTKAAEKAMYDWVFSDLAIDQSLRLHQEGDARKPSLRLKLDESFVHLVEAVSISSVSRLVDTWVRNDAHTELTDYPEF